MKNIFFVNFEALFQNGKHASTASALAEHSGISQEQIDLINIIIRPIHKFG